MVHILLNSLQKKPIIGFVSGIGASIIQYINAIEPYFKLFGFITGIIIALLTIYAKILEIKKLRKQKK